MKLVGTFLFNVTASTNIYTLSLHDALPISRNVTFPPNTLQPISFTLVTELPVRSEEHTSELQSRLHLVCRLLLEKKKKSTTSTYTYPILGPPSPSSYNPCIPSLASTRFRTA